MLILHCCCHKVKSGCLFFSGTPFLAHGLSLRDACFFSHASTFELVVFCGPFCVFERVFVTKSTLRSVGHKF